MAERRTYDNAGTPGTCDSEVDWKADASGNLLDPSVGVVRAATSIKAGSGLLAATDAAAIELTS